MDWIEVNSQEKVQELNDIFWGFHDSILKEICYSTGGYVREDLSMNVIGNHIARFLFQRMYEEPSVIEIEFRDIIQINIKAEEKDEGIDIIDANLYLEDGIFFWSRWNYEYKDKDKDKYTWIAAKKVYWRKRDDLLGEKGVYLRD